MKEYIKQIPFIGPLLVLIKHKIKPVKGFQSSNYWDERYKTGGNSGAGSYDNLANFKAEVINDFIEERELSSAIEFGCGDGNQLKYFQIKSYTGLDVSSTAIEICNNLYKRDESKTFKLYQSNVKERAELSMSLDVIYHLVEDKVFEQYMNNLFNAAEKYVIIYSSNKVEDRTNSKHVKHRKFSDWVEINNKEFKLIQEIPNKFPFDGSNENTSFANFYIYERI